MEIWSGNERLYSAQTENENIIALKNVYGKIFSNGGNAKFSMVFLDSKDNLVYFGCAMIDPPLKN
jgi:hypothetical protein